MLRQHAAQKFSYEVCVHTSVRAISETISESRNILASAGQTEVRERNGTERWIYERVTADDTAKSGIIITLEKVEDDHRWLMSVQ